MKKMVGQTMRVFWKGYFTGFGVATITAVGAVLISEILQRINY